MLISLTRKQEALVRRLVESGRYASEQDVLAAALERLEAFDNLRRDVQDGIEALDRGDYIAYDDETLEELFEGVKTRGRAKLSRQPADSV